MIDIIRQKPTCSTTIVGAVYSGTFLKIKRDIYDGIVSHIDIKMETGRVLKWKWDP